MKKIQIIVGTMMGTAAGIANYIQHTLGDTYTIEVNLEAQQGDLLRDGDELLVFCTSNTGCGDLPDNILPFYEALIHKKPDIAGRHYCLINIGDSYYPTYGEAGVKLDEALRTLGATPISETLLIDSSANRYPQKTAVEWLTTALG